MTLDKWRAVGFGSAVHLARFLVIILGLWLAPLLGIGGWYQGLFANVLCVVFAVALVTWRGLWRSIGITRLWAGRAAALVLLVLLAESLLWTVPGGLTEQPPGYGWWAVTLLLVGVNEELVSRGVVLARMRASFTRFPAVAVTAALFGLQHLSAFATTSRDAYDVLTNVLVSACYGFLLAAFQYRFRWILPLILLHAFADFTAILSTDGHSDLVVAATLLVFVGLGILLLRRITPARGTVVLRHDNDPGAVHETVQFSTYPRVKGEPT